MFYSSSDFSVNCDMGTVGTSTDCSNSVVSTVINDISSGDQYVKIFHEPDPNLEFQMENHVKNDSGISYVHFYLNYTTNDQIVVNLIDRGTY